MDFSPLPICMCNHLISPSPCHCAPARCLQVCYGMECWLTFNDGWTLSVLSGTAVWTPCRNGGHEETLQCRWFYLFTNSLNILQPPKLSPSMSLCLGDLSLMQRCWSFQAVLRPFVWRDGHISIMQACRREEWQLLTVLLLKQHQTFYSWN